MAFRCASRTVLLRGRLCVPDSLVARHAGFTSVVQSLLTCTQSAFVAVHDSTQLPWWAVIALVTAVTKAVSFPLMAMSHKNALMCAVLSPHLEKYRQQIKSKVEEEAFRYRWTDRRKRQVYAYNVARISRQIYEKQGCHPYRSQAIVVFQLPVWFSYSITFRRLALLNGVAVNGGSTDMKTEGLWWFTDLTAPDAYFIMPVLIALSNYAIFKLMLPPLKGQQIRWVMRLSIALGYGGTLLLPLAASIAPSALSFYWLMSSAVTFWMHVLIRQPRFKAKFKIPLLPYESRQPFHDLLKRLIPLK